MADGYSRVHNGRRLGVCAVQAGPGAENAFAGVAQAGSDGIPILVIPGGTRRERRGVPYSFSATEQYRGVTKWADEVNLPERIPEMMRRAFSALRNGRRGPVLLELPNDVGAAEVDPRRSRRMSRHEDTGPPRIPPTWTRPFARSAARASR